MIANLLYSLGCSNVQPKDQLISAARSACLSPNCLGVALQLTKTTRIAVVIVDMDRMTPATGRMVRFFSVGNRRIVEEVAYNQIVSTIIEVIEVSQTPKDVRRFVANFVPPVTCDFEAHVIWVDSLETFVNWFIVVGILDAR